MSQHATIHHGDCLDVLRSMPDNSVHAIVTDPPYGLSNTTPDQVAETIVKWVSSDREYLPSGKGFMGKAWDGFVPPVAVWDEAMRVLKPGGHVLAFAGTRTHDLMTLGLRLAGFDIRDSLAWLYGSGFPKSMDVGKAIDKAAGAEREVIGIKKHARDGDVSGQAWSHNGKSAGAKYATGGASLGAGLETAPATDAAKQWEGWGTALKPATEPIVMARKPFKSAVAANVLKHGTGGLNIDATRIGEESGRWPANVILDEHMAGVLDEQSGTIPPSKRRANKEFSREGRSTNFAVGARGGDEWGYTDSGGASRFFYVAKASKRERPDVDGIKHPTVKPLALMQWLVRLVTPPNGIVLDPFAGSGTTIEAAMIEGFDVIGIEREAEYLPLIHERIRRAQPAQTEAPEQGAFAFKETP